MKSKSLVVPQKAIWILISYSVDNEACREFPALTHTFLITRMSSEKGFIGNSPLKTNLYEIIYARSPLFCKNKTLCRVKLKASHNCKSTCNVKMFSIYNYFIRHIFPFKFYFFIRLHLSSMVRWVNDQDLIFDVRVSLSLCCEKVKFTPFFIVSSSFQRFSFVSAVAVAGFYSLRLYFHFVECFKLFFQFRSRRFVN